MAHDDQPTRSTSSSGPERPSVFIHPGERIGRFVVRQILGEGGFGVVYQAEQTEPVRRTVALKVIKPGMDTAAVVARFEAERQALAMMDHPCVAKVLEAGATPEGRPYFAMELVKGLPITEHCDRHRLNITERIEIFIRVCEAVQHAHSKGVIHRDLKPSNILVEYEGQKSTPKIIDFGIAKALHHRLTEATVFTHQGTLIGTPEYMSPEQAEMGRQDIDTRSDVYSLGVVLYEVLIGGCPFESETLRAAGYGEIQRIIREVEPLRPSTRLAVLTTGSDTAAATRVANARRTDLRTLGGALRRDLDWVVMRCLEKRRDRRYDTAEALAMDLRRYLSHEPVLAGPPSVGYKVTKFVRRNRVGVAAASVFLILLVGGLAGTSIGLLRAARAAEREAEQRRLADTRAAEAEAAREQARAAEVAASASAKKERARAEELRLVSEFQADMLGQMDARQAGARLLSDIRERFSEALRIAGVSEPDRAAREAAFGAGLGLVNATDTAATMIDLTILRPAVAAIDEQFASQPIVDASLRQTVSNLYRSLGRYADALPLQTHALEGRRRALGEADPDTLRSIGYMASLLLAMGRLADAEPFNRELLDKSTQFLGESDPITLTAINDLALVLQNRGRYPEAERLYREALDKTRRALGEDDPSTITAINNIGYLLEAQGKAADALPHIRDALQRRKRVLGEDHPDTLGSMNNLGYLLLDQGKVPEAEALYRDALERRRRVLGEEHPDTLESMNNLGVLLRRQGRLAEAGPLFQRTLEVRRRVLGQDHRRTLSSIENLAQQCQAQGKLPEADALYVEAIDRRRRTLGPEHPDTLSSISLLALARQAQGKNAEAETLHREALEIRVRVLGPDHPDTVRSNINLGYNLTIQNRSREAVPLYRHAMDVRRRVLGPDHTDTLLSIVNMGSLLRDCGDAAFAEPLHRESLDGYTRTLGPDHWRTADAHLQLGRTLSALVRFADAEAELIQAETGLAAAKGAPSARHGQCIEALISLYQSWSKVEPGKRLESKVVEWTLRRKAEEPATPRPAGG